MNAMVAHELAWVTAGPLWKGAVQRPEVMRRPTILGFASDNFMDDLLGQLASAPESINVRVATGKSPSFRERQPREAFDARPETSQLKLYQPAHGWFYLTAGSLVCLLPGLPDHAVDLAGGDRVGFVVRRLSGNAELASISDSRGRKSWLACPDPNVLLEGEELLPMFPLGFQERERRRRMLAGVIPTASQDSFQSAPMADTANANSAEGKPSPVDAFEDMRGRVIQAIQLLKDRPPSNELQGAVQAALQANETSRFILLDLADFLHHYIPAALSAIQGGGTPSGACGQLVLFLRAGDANLAGKSLADLLNGALATPLTAPFVQNLGQMNVSVLPLLEARLKAALEEASQTTLDMVVVEEQNATATRYVARLVYQRPQCGPLHADVVSARSEPFTLASYFDPEAPARPIRIALPFDVSIQGLRQFRKNVKLVLSEGLRKKVASIGKINGGIEGPGFDCGGISLSIPIITICAMIILFVMLFVLNIIFWWLPFVKICFPKLKVEL